MTMSGRFGLAGLISFVIFAYVLVSHLVLFEAWKANDHSTKRHPWSTQSSHHEAPINFNSPVFGGASGENIVINVLVDHRIDSLQRFCNSLLASEFTVGHAVAIEFHLQANHPASITEYLTAFAWPYGPMTVHARIVERGHFERLVESWYPTSLNEFMYAIVLEDQDVEVPPQFWKALKQTLSSFIAAGSPSTILGVSLFHAPHATNASSGLYFPGAWTRALVSPFVHQGEVATTAITSKVITDGCGDSAVVDFTSPYRTAANDGSTHNQKCPLLLEIEQRSLVLPPPQRRLSAGGARNSVAAPGDSSAANIVIHVLVNRRLSPLKRLCNSLLAADYEGDSGVALEFHLEANQPLEITQYVVDFDWPHGRKLVHARVAQGGLIAVVVESWFPASDREYAVLLEDDIEVSPLFYAYLKAMLGSYFQAGSPDDVMGISLYTPRVVETEQVGGDPISHRSFHPDELIFNITGRRQRPYLQQLPCSWGALFFPRPWRQFVSYMQLRTSRETQRFLIPKSTTTGWKASWKKFMIELAWAENLLMLYPNFDRQASLSTNHLEVGEHIKEGDPHHVKADYTVPLLRDKNAFEKWLEAPLVWDNLPVLNLFGKPYEKELLQASLVKVRAVDDTSPWRRAGDDLVVSADRPWGGRLTAGLFALCVQEDGNLVVYNLDARSEELTTPAWRSRTGSKRTVGHEVRLRLEQDGNLALVESWPLVWRWQRSRVLWATHTHGSPGPHFLLLRTGGALQVFRGENPCTAIAPVWSSEGVPRVDQTSELVDREICRDSTKSPPKACSVFLPRVNEFMRRAQPNRLTVLMRHTGGSTLTQSLAHYAGSPLVSSILVAWGGSAKSKPLDMRLGSTTVHFTDPYPEDDFYPPSMRITTSAILVVDDITLVHHEDIGRLFTTWQQEPESIVGLFAVQFERLVGKWTSRRLGLGSASSQVHAISSNGALFHVDLMSKLSCEASPTAFTRKFAVCGEFALSIAGSIVNHRSVHLQANHPVSFLSHTKQHTGEQMLPWKCDLHSLF